MHDCDLVQYCLLKNTVKTKVYKNDKANQGEGIYNFLPCSAFFLLLRCPSGQTSLIVAPSLFHSPASPNTIMISQLFSRDIPIIHAPACPQLCPYACASCFLFCCCICPPSLPVVLYANTWRYGFYPYVPKLYAFSGLAK